jgi:hypothetical protein
VKNDVYGSQTLTLVELGERVGAALGVSFAEHESYFRGPYLMAMLVNGSRIEIQPNTVPGDDDEEFYATEYAVHSVLVLVQAPDAAAASVRQRLSTVEGLTLLDSG